MTNDELKHALLSEEQVQCGGVIYDKVHAIRYSKADNKISVSAELIRRSDGRTILITSTKDIIAKPKQIKFI